MSTVKSEVEFHFVGFRGDFNPIKVLVNAFTVNGYVLL